MMACEKSWLLGSGPWIDPLANKSEHWWSIVSVLIPGGPKLSLWQSQANTTTIIACHNAGRE